MEVYASRPGRGTYKHKYHIGQSVCVGWQSEQTEDDYMTTQDKGKKSDKGTERVARATEEILKLVMDNKEARSALFNGMINSRDTRKISEDVSEAIKSNKAITENDMRRIIVDALGYIDPLTAISPVDGRYWEDVKVLSPFSSEMGIIKTRVEIEAKYLIALSEIGNEVKLVRPLSDAEKKTLMEIGPTLSFSSALRVKEIENKIHHDVKAMERAFREFIGDISLGDTIDMIHFGLTSEDVNNLTYRLLFKRALDTVCIPAMNKVIDGLMDRAADYEYLTPMLCRTHGQPAVPGMLSKELANMAVSIDTQVRKLEVPVLTGKLTGAVGNFNALVYAAPEVDWVKFSKSFVNSFGFTPNLFTTQINRYEDMIEVFQTMQRINGIFQDIDKNLWRYISDDWFKQLVVKGEVGSSTMPQKVNPINFENSEGNSAIANGLFEAMGRALQESRLSRHLSDSTIIRNVGVALSHSLLTYSNTMVGLERISPNREVIRENLHENWVILTEGVQTYLRRVGVKDPYTMVAGISRGQKITQEDWGKWVDTLPIEKEHKAKLMELTPESYIGYSRLLIDLAQAQIADPHVQTIDPHTQMLRKV